MTYRVCTLPSLHQLFQINTTNKPPRNTTLPLLRHRPLQSTPQAAASSPPPPTQRTPSSASKMAWTPPSPPQTAPAPRISSAYPPFSATTSRKTSKPNAKAAMPTAQKKRFLRSKPRYCNTPGDSGVSCLVSWLAGWR